MPNIFLTISEIASFVGQNKWDYVTPFERLWKKSDPNYGSCLEEFNKKALDKKDELTIIENEKLNLEQQLASKQITKREYNKLVKENDSKKVAVEKVIMDINTKIEDITLTQSQKIEKDLGKELISVIASASKETVDKRKITNEAIDKLEKEGKIKIEQKQELLKQTESFINKTHGTLKEDSAIKIYEERFNVKLDVSQKYHKFFVKKTADYFWYIGGKMDGIYIDPENPENNYVVEVKNRTKGFFTSLRDYEKTQIQLYLLLTGFKTAKLVEKYNTKIRVTEVILEQEYIDNIVEYLTIFIDNVDTFFGNDNFEKKVMYLNMSEHQKQKFLSSLYLDEIIKLQRHKEEVKIIETQGEQDCLLDDLDDF